MDDRSVARRIRSIGLVLLILAAGAALFRFWHKPSTDAVPAPLQREFLALAVETIGKPVPDARAITQEQLDEMLYLSAGHATPGMVGWLLSRGASPRANRNKLGLSQADRSALQEAAGLGRCESESLLIKRVEALTLASTGGPVAQRPALVAEQVALFVNESDTHRSSPLHDAVAGGERQCVEALLAAGARVEARNESGVTPLAYARQHQLGHLVPMLKSALQQQGGFDPGEVTAYGVLR